MSKKKLRGFEAFAGIGAQHAALKRLNIDFEIVGISEWFINALLTYDAIHDNHDKEIFIRGCGYFFGLIFIII